MEYAPHMRVYGAYRKYMEYAPIEYGVWGAYRVLEHVPIREMEYIEYEEYESILSV